MADPMTRLAVFAELLKKPISEEYARALFDDNERLAEQVRKLRSQLAKLVDEVTHVISGGDDPLDKCLECGCAGIGMLRDARTDSIALLKETEPGDGG